MQKKLLILLSVFLTLDAFSIEPIDSIYETDPYFILMGEADAAIENENWSEAAARLCDAIAVKPNNPSNALLFNNLASVYIAMQQDSIALETYNKALDIAPSMVTVLNGKGRLLLKIGRDYEAFDVFDNVLEIDSLNSTARFYHGMMALYGGNLQIAESDFEVLNTVAPKSLDTAVALSALYALTGRDSEAIPYLRQLIEQDPAPEYYAQLAGCYLSMGQLFEASEIISDGFFNYPDDPELYYYRAWLNRDRYLINDARADAKKAIELGATPAKVNALFE